MTTSALNTSVQRRQNGWSRAVAVGGIALLLTVAVGITTWESADRRESAPTTLTEPGGVEAAAATVHTSRAIPLGAAAIYIVGSQAEATRVLGAIDEANRHRYQFGEPLLSATVVVVTSAEEEAAVMEAQYDANAIRATMDLAPIALTDLRGR